MLPKSCLIKRKLGLLLPSGPTVNNNSSDESSMLSLSKNVLYPPYPVIVYWYESTIEKSEDNNLTIAR